MIIIEKYKVRMQKEWDNFCQQSKNPMFMFQRGFMDYHKNRFEDNSLMFYENGILIALLPSNIKGNVLFSHGGLTFGGFIINDRMKQHTMNDCFEALMLYMKENGITRIVYKLIPHIYHVQPAEEDKYCLYFFNANIEKIEASTVINLKNALKMSKGRKAQISRAKREGVTIAELHSISDFETFISMENEILKDKHNTQAVHTGAELKLLHDRFPQNINLIGAIYQGKLIAGTVIFEYEDVIHTQYMATNEKAREIGALDLIIYTIIEKYKSNKSWLDFGISTEDAGRYLNLGLISQKEGFGGRTNVYETWSLGIKGYTKEELRRGNKNAF